MTTNKPRFKMYDGLTNIYTSIGTKNDSRLFNQFQYSPFFNYQELDCVYRESSVARKIVDIIPNDATKNWRSFNMEQNEELQQAEYDLMLPQHFNELLRLSRLSGGSLMLMLIDGQELDKPLDLKKVQQGDLKRLINFDRYEVYPSNTNVTDILNKNYLLPEFYMIENGHTPIHYSHFVRINGEWLPRRLNRQEYGWGDSVLRKCLENIKDLTAASNSMAGLITKSNIDVLSMEGFFQAISSGHDQEIINAIQAYKLGLSTTNVAVTDATSQFDRHSVSMGGVSEAVAELRVQVAAAAQIPVNRFWGETPAGLSNSETGEERKYYDHIRGLQESVYRHSLQTLDDVLCLSTLGEIPDDFNWEWNPLFELSSEEQANRDRTQAEIDQMRIDQGVPVSVILKQLQAEKKYAIDDKHIQAVEAHEKDQEGDTDLAIQNALQQYQNEQQKNVQEDTTKQSIPES